MSPLRKLNGAERLVVGRRRNRPFICLHIEESLDLCRTPVAQMAHRPATPMPADKERTQYRYPIKAGKTNAHYSEEPR